MERGKGKRKGIRRGARKDRGVRGGVLERGRLKVGREVEDELEN